MKRSRSCVVRLTAFLGTRTITGVDPTTAPPLRASTVISPGLVLACPNFPATKKDTDAPPVGTLRSSVSEKVPVVPLRKCTAPPPGAATMESVTDTVGAVVPAGLLTRMRHGAGVQPTNRAAALALLLICNSTSIATLLTPEQAFRGSSIECHRRRRNDGRARRRAQA